MAIELTNEEFKEAVRAGEILTFDEVFDNAVSAWNDTFTYQDVLPVTKGSLTVEEDVDWITDRLEGIHFKLDTIGFARALKSEANGDNEYSTNPYKYVTVSNIETDNLTDKLWFDGNDKLEVVTNHNIEELK